MTAFWAALAFLIAAVVLACIGAVLVACGWLTVALRRPARKPAERQAAKEKP